MVAIHDDELAMLTESLPEFVALARLGIDSKKAKGGALGYPTAALLLAVVEIIGSHLRKREGVEPYVVPVPGTAKPQSIKNKGDHFLALNSPYFGYTFPSEQIGKLYEMSRCPLTHSAILGIGIRLHVDEPIPGGITFRADGAHISLPDFLQRCECAVALFIADAPTLLPDSAAVAELARKSYSEANAEIIKELKANAGNWGQSVQASGMGTPPKRPT
jgi:hypothetical protein